MTLQKNLSNLGAVLQKYFLSSEVFYSSVDVINRWMDGWEYLLIPGWEICDLFWFVQATRGADLPLVA